MSPRLKRQSSDQIITALGQLGFEIASQRGSHVKLQRAKLGDQRQVLTIPRHKELATGTLRAIARQAAKYLNESEIRRIFFSE